MKQADKDKSLANTKAKVSHSPSKASSPSSTISSNGNKSKNKNETSIEHNVGNGSAGKNWDLLKNFTRSFSIFSQPKNDDKDGIVKDVPSKEKRFSPIHKNREEQEEKLVIILHFLLLC